MIRRGISLAMAAAILIVYLQSQLASNDALFLFISSNLVINIGLVGLSSMAVWLSFQTKFRSARSYISAAIASVSLSLIGLIGVLSASLDRYMFDVIKPLDYLLILETGIIFSICTLSYQHPAVKQIPLPQLNITRIKRWAASWLPPLPESSHRSRPHTA